jgi:septal ring factor EnvC (AmiA/AmiB activator)
LSVPAPGLPVAAPVAHIAYNINPALAASTWARLMSTLRQAVTVARKALPWAGGVALITAASAIAFHIATVKVPDWIKQTERRAARIKAREARRAAEVASASGNSEVNNLMEELTALRAEVDMYRNAAMGTSALITNNSSPDLYLPPVPGDYSMSNNLLHMDTHMTLAHIKSLEAANASLREALSAMSAELDHRVRQGTAMVSELKDLQAKCQTSEGEVERLNKEIQTLQTDKDAQGRRIAVLEENLEQLRVVSIWTLLVHALVSRFKEFLAKFSFQSLF